MVMLFHWNFTINSVGLQKRGRNITGTNQSVNQSCMVASSHAGLEKICTIWRNTGRSELTNYISISALGEGRGSAYFPDHCKQAWICLECMVTYWYVTGSPFRRSHALAGITVLFSGCITIYPTWGRLSTAGMLDVGKLAVDSFCCIIFDCR